MPSRTSLTAEPFGMYILTVKEIILFESYPELDGSPWMIYQEMKHRGLDKKYKLVWAVGKDFKAPAGIRTVPFFGSLSRLQRWRRSWYNAKAKLIVDSNRPIFKKNPETVRLYTRHGGPFKKCEDYMHSLGKMDYMLTLSSELQKIDFQVVHQKVKYQIG